MLEIRIMRQKLTKITVQERYSYWSCIDYFHR